MVYSSIFWLAHKTFHLESEQIRNKDSCMTIYYCFLWGKDMILNPSLQFSGLLRGLWGRTAGTKLPRVEQPVCATDQVEEIQRRQQWHPAIALQRKEDCWGAQPPTPLQVLLWSLNQDIALIQNKHHIQKRRLTSNLCVWSFPSRSRTSSL